MAQELRMRPGEEKQLRAHGEVERWASARPEIVSVTDEDVVNGTPGGGLKALAQGTARITAIGFGGELLIEVDVVVEKASAITVAVGDRSALAGLPAAARLISSNSQVAEITDDRFVRGVSPGIAVVRAEGSNAELQVRVSGSREIEVNQRLALAGYFDVPVRGWRSCSAGAATIDNRGNVIAGDRPRSVPIVVTLDDGSEFSFDLRIARSQSTRQPAFQPADGQAGEEAARNQTGPAGYEAPTAPYAGIGAASSSSPASRTQRQEVEAHLARARELIGQKHWQQAGSELMAAGLAAVGDDELRQRVQAARERSRAGVLQEAAEQCAAVAAALRQGRFAQGREMLRNVRVPTDQLAIVEHLSALADAIEAAEINGDPGESAGRLHARLEAVWNMAQSAGVASLLVELAAIAIQWDVEQMVSVIIDSLTVSSFRDCPQATRGALESALIQMGEVAIAESVNRLSRVPANDGSGQWLLDLFAALDPWKHPGLITRLYRGMPPQGKSNLVERLSQMTTRSCGALLDLLSAVLGKLPPDPQLAHAVRSKVGAAALEQAAVKWASGGHKGAQAVLVRLFGYQPTLFNRR